MQKKKTIKQKLAPEEKLIFNIDGKNIEIKDLGHNYAGQAASVTDEEFKKAWAKAPYEYSDEMKHFIHWDTAITRWCLDNKITPVTDLRNLRDLVKLCDHFYNEGREDQKNGTDFDKKYAKEDTPASENKNTQFDINSFKFVDLGLPSGKLWATENIKDENGDEAFFSFDDSVNAFGKNLPSKEDWKELFDNSSYSWNEERKGYDVTGPNGNSIFLPAAGYRNGIGVRSVGSDGYYWSSSVVYENDAYIVYFNSGNLYPQNSNARYLGFSVHLVR